MRRSEVASLTGFPFYAFGVGVSLFFFPYPIAILSSLYLIYGDPFSGIIGNLYGKNKIYGNKTLEGFLGNFFLTFFITLFFSSVFEVSFVKAISFSIFGAFCSAITELFSGKIDDNFAIPVFSGMGLFFYDMVFGVF